MPTVIVALAFALASALGCAASPGKKVAEDMKVFQEEETPQKLIARGKAFASVGDFTRAEQYLSAAIEQGADPGAVLPLLLKICVAERRFRVALDYAEPYLRKSPSDYRLRFVVASLYVSIGDITNARKALEQVVKDKPGYAAVHFALAVLLRDEEGDIVGADEHFREYLRLEPRGGHAEEARASLLKTVRAPAPVPLAIPEGPFPIPAPLPEGPLESRMPDGAILPGGQSGARPVRIPRDDL